MTRARAVVIALAALVAACSPALDWREFNYAEGGFAVLLPGKPRSESRTVAIDGVEVTMRMFSVHVEGLAFGAGYADFPPGANAEVRTRRLAATRDALVANIDGRVTSQGALTLEAHPGIDFRARGRLRDADYVLAGRVYAVGDRLYQLAVVGREEAAPKADAELFLGSFRLLPK